MLEAYTRRQTWLARLQAVEVAKVLFGEGKPGQTPSQPAREVSTAAIFDRMSKR